jgi:hypothetical protein
MSAKTYRNQFMAVAGMLYLFERASSVVTKSIEEALRFQLTRTAKKMGEAAVLVAKFRII